MRKHFNCEHCDADFKINYDLNEDYYEVHFCPFCGAQINEEDDEDDEYE
jgi:rRNA maturation endonuclease Nob1